MASTTSPSPVIKCLDETLYTQWKCTGETHPPNETLVYKCQQSWHVLYDTVCGCSYIVHIYLMQSWWIPQDLATIHDSVSVGHRGCGSGHCHPSHCFLAHFSHLYTNYTLNKPKICDIIVGVCVTLPVYTHFVV